MPHRRAGADIIQIEPVGAFHIDSGEGEINIRLRDLATNFFNLRTMRPVTRLGNQTNDKGSLCHLPPNTWSKVYWSAADSLSRNEGC